MLVISFFFSSRRRHTISTRDWSSDVCSSDLILEGLRELDWVPVDVEEQRIRNESRRGFQKHMVRLRRTEQMEALDEWNVELVLLNSHDAGCAYQLHAVVYRRVCDNGLVISEDCFQALRFRHAGLKPEEVVQASLRLVE